jgi:hypothetical protein
LDQEGEKRVEHVSANQNAEDVRPVSYLRKVGSAVNSTWIRIEDTMPEHPKFLKAGPRASWLFVSTLCWSARLLTDGRVPAEAFPRIMPEPDIADLVDILVNVGLLDRTDDGYQIHNYEQHQRTRAQVEEDREKNRRRQQRVRKPDVTPMSRRDTPVTNADVTPMSQRDTPVTGVPASRDCHADVTLPESESESDADTESISHRVNRLATILADKKMEGRKVNNPVGYRKQVTAEVLTNHGPKLRLLLEKYPNATDNQLLGEALGEQTSLAGPQPVTRCRHCGKIQFDCQCPPLNLVEDTA